MLQPRRTHCPFDDERLVADAGLLPATLAVGLGLRHLLDTYIDLGRRPGGQAWATRR